MPTYEYQCVSCKHTFEQFQSITAKPLTKCPECGRKVRRLIGGGAGILFKGSGFYQTDYRSSKYQEAARKDKSSGETPKAEKKGDKGDASKSKGTPGKKSGK